MLRNEWIVKFMNSPDGRIRVATSWGATGAACFDENNGNFVVYWDDMDRVIYSDISHLRIVEDQEVKPVSNHKVISSVSKRLREIELALEEMTARRLFIPASVIAEHNSLVHILRDESRNK